MIQVKTFKRYRGFFNDSVIPLEDYDRMINEFLRDKKVINIITNKTAFSALSYTIVYEVEK